MISFYFLYAGKLLKLPVNPSSLSVRAPGRNSVIETASAGEVSLLRAKGLTELTISSYFPAQSEGFAPPLEYVRFFSAARDEKKPVTLSASGLSLDIQASVEGFEYSFRAGEEGDIYYTLSLKEYSKAELKLPEAAQSGAAAAQSTRASEPPRLTVGSAVIVNGRLHRDSYGAGPGKTLADYRGKLSIIKEGRPYPYHVVTTGGGALGWVKAECVKGA